MWIVNLVICFTLAEYLFSLYVNLRQWKRYKIKTLPDELKAVATEEEFIKSQNYGFDKISFSMVKTYVSTLETILILYFNVIPYIWEKSHDFLLCFGLEGEIYQALAYSYVLMLIGIFDDLPFSLYSTFAIEERYGFNKTTMKEFIKDILKNTLVTAAITGVVLPILLWIIDWGGEYFYLYVWGFLTVVILVISHIYHDWIAQLYNTFTELEDGTLKTAINELAKRLKFPLKNIYVVDGDRRSEHSNAYFFGFWKNKRIVLFNTLLKKEKNISEDEIIAILAHELGHWKLSHFLKGILILELQILVMFYLFGKVMYTQELYRQFGFSKQNSFIGLMLFSYIYAPVNVVLSIILTFRSRRQEFQADAFAKKNDYGDLLKTALIKIHTQNSGNIYPDPLYSAINFSHPPLLERLKAL
ncbi:unnamed protein product [Blepharisma stoltei]|uniref:CAAX prenyl protease n=1 Tax=Blepharisma stoltei TaxID=1481888 RepID=A0AAU9ITA0_9CILI|nr:unnamed protein product [Blepharisma stoltei]